MKLRWPKSKTVRLLEEVRGLVQQLVRQGVVEMARIDDLLDSVTELPSIGDSLDAVFAQLQELIAQGQTDPAKLEQAIALVATHKERTKAAILANTPAAPVPPTA